MSIEQEGPQPQLVISPDRALCARYHVKIDEVNRLVDTALGGEPVGTSSRGSGASTSSFASRALLTSPDAVGRLPVFSSAGTPIPLAQVARIEVTDGQTIIAREEGRRRLTVRTDIAGRDQAGFVAEAQKLFGRELALPPGYRLSWLGMFENLDRARRHFAVVVPVTVLLIYALLFVTFRSHRAALLLLTSVPLAFIGGALALFARGMNLNVSTGVGFAALFGVSIMNGVLLVRVRRHAPADRGTHRHRPPVRRGRRGRAAGPVARPAPAAAVLQGRARARVGVARAPHRTRIRAEAIMDRMPNEDHERTFNTSVRWSRRGPLPLRRGGPAPGSGKSARLRGVLSGRCR